MKRLPILMYHGLHATPRDRGCFDPVYSVTPDDFALQMDWLEAAGYRSIQLRDLARPGPLPPKAVLVTFDDGDASNLEVATPLLVERGMVAEFFVTSDFVGRPGMLSVAGVRALADAGMGIGSHGRTHAFLEDLSDVALAEELQASRDRLADICGADIDALALPGGRGGRRERVFARARGYHHLLGSTPGPNRFPAGDGWWQRIAVTRSMPLERFGQLVDWSGFAPRAARARHLALALPKKMLGNQNYQRLRARLL